MIDDKLINQEAEACILGTIIINNNHLVSVQDFLEPKHFACPDHQKIYEHILKSDTASNKITLKNLFAGLPCGVGYLSDLLGQASNIVPIKDYAKLLIELWQKRELKDIMSNIDFSSDFNSIKDVLDGKVADLQFVMAKEPKKIDLLIEGILQKNEQGTRELLDLGFAKTDNLIGGMEMGSLVIVGGKSSMGKTTLVLNFAKTVAQSKSVLFFSVEVNEDQIASKILVEDASINPYRLRRNDLKDIEISGVSHSKERLKGANLFVDDTSGLTLGKMRAKIKRMLFKHDIKLVIIDYLQLMKSESKEFSREQEISKIAIGLKDIAKEFNIVVMALSQLSRGSDSRESKRPILSDLRDSGSVEQAADVVLFIHRDEYYLEREKYNKGHKHYEEWQELLEESRNKADLIISKNRNGKIGEVEYFFDSSFGRFTEIN